jgi:NitT/TauT family transport system substrate-binding protein
MRRRDRLTFALVLLLPLVAAVGCARRESETEKGSGPALRRVVLQTDWFPQAEHGGYYQALARGFYREAGLDVEVWPGGPGSGIKLKVARGDADFGLLRSDDLILSVARDMPLVMVAATMQHDPQALMVHADSPVRTFRDLDGRAVIGNVGMVFYPYLESKYGIKLIRRQNTYGLGEFFANPDTIQQCMVTNEPFFAAQNGHQVRTLPLMSAGYDCYQVLFTRREVIRRSPDLVRQFVHASIRGWRDYLEQDPNPADDLILQRNPDMTRELLAFSRRELIRGAYVQGDAARGEGIGQLSPERLAAQLETLLQLKILERRIKVADTMTTEFLPAIP